MRTHCVTVYTFDELPATTQQKVLDRLYHTNVDHGWWELTYDWFRELAGSVGITVKDIYFTGFSCQGSGSSYVSSVDFSDLLKGIVNGSYREISPKDTPALTPCNAGERLLNFIEHGFIELSASTSAEGNGESLRVQFDDSGLEDFSERIQDEVGDLESWIEDQLVELNRWLYRKLEAEFEFQTSEEQIKNSILSNGLEFDEGGNSI